MRTPDTPQIEEEPISRIALSLFIILLGSFTAPLLIHSSTVAIPSIAEDLRLPAEVVSWFTFVTAVGSLMMVLPRRQDLRHLWQAAHLFFRTGVSRGELRPGSQRQFSAGPDSLPIHPGFWHGLRVGSSANARYQHPET